MSSPLLINEPPLCLQPSLAVAIGLNEALILQQIHYWLNPRWNKNIAQGRLWVHNTYEQWQKQFPFWGEKTIRRTIANLENRGLLISYLSTRQFKKTKFYSIDYEALQTVSSPSVLEEDRGSQASGHIDQIDLPKPADGSGQIDQMQVVNVTRSYNKDTETTAESTLLSSKPFPALKDEKEILRHWNEIVQSKLGGQPVSLTTKRLQALQSIFTRWFQKDMTQWQSYCTKISTCQFLMGGSASGFRVHFDWALKPDNIAKILENALYDQGSSSPPRNLSWEAFEAHLVNTIDCSKWRVISLALAKKVGQPAYRSWFAKIRLVDLKDGVAHFTAPTQFTASYIQAHYDQELIAAVRRVYPQVKTLQFSLGDL